MTVRRDAPTLGATVLDVRDLSFRYADGAFELVLPTDRPEPVIDADGHDGADDATSDHG